MIQPTTNPTRKRKITKKTMDRRANVLLQCIKGYNNSQIAFNLKIDRSTVKSDLDLMVGDVIDWTNNLALIGWLKKVEELYIETNQAISNITQLQKNIQEGIEDDKFEWNANPFDPSTQPEDYLKFENIKSKAYSAYQTRINHYSEFAQLENAKTKAKEFLVGMTTHIPLFASTQRLAIYYQQNEQKKLNLVEQPTTTPQLEN